MKIFEPISAVDKTIINHLKNDGYEFNLCWMGNYKQDYRVTFRGNYIGNNTDKNTAIMMAIFHQDERDSNLLKLSTL